MRVQTGLTGETHVKHEVARIFEVLVQPENLDARFGERRRNDLSIATLSAASFPGSAVASCIQLCSSHPLIAPASCSTDIAQPRNVRVAGRFALVITIVKPPAETNPFAQGSDSGSAELPLVHLSMEQGRRMYCGGQRRALVARTQAVPVAASSANEASACRATSISLSRERSPASLAAISFSATKRRIS